MKVVKVFLIVLVFLIGISAIILSFLFHHRNVERKVMNDAARKNVAGSFIKLSAGVTHYELSGPDTGKVVVLLNGFSVPYYIWDGTTEFLAKNGYRVLRFDGYGRGYSDRPDTTYNKELFLGQIAELVIKLKLRAPFTLAGVSFGGELATDFTCKYPKMVNKVILVDPGFQTKPAAPRFVVNYEMTTHPNEQAAGQIKDFNYPERHPEWYDKYWEQMEYKGFRNALISTLFEYKNTAKQSLECLNDTHKPVLLIWGESDVTSPFTFSDTVRKILKTQFVPIKDAAHLPNFDQPQKFNAAVITFLKK